MVAQGTGVTALDPRLLPAARQVLSGHGLSGMTLERLSGASGLSRMTLHRRGVTVPRVVEALLADATGEYQSAVLPALAGAGSAAVRLRAVLLATFTAADRHLPLLAGLFSRTDSVFHDPPQHEAGDGAPVASADAFVAPFARLLRDGAADRSLRTVEDPDLVAAALFNVAGWGYVHLRHAQRWTSEQAGDAVLELVLSGLAVPPGAAAPAGPRPAPPT